MKKFKNLKVGTKVIFMCLAILSVILVGAFTFVITSTASATEASANNLGFALCEKNAQIVESALEDKLRIARSIADTMEGFKDLDREIRRDVYNSMLRSILERNDDVVGVWVCMDPDALDGSDKYYKNEANHDATGRFIPYWFKSEGKILTRALTGYEEEGGYYDQAKQANHDIITEPLEYDMNGTMVMMTSLEVPIRDRNGNFVGVAGVNMALTDLQQIAFDKGEYDNSFVYLLSNKGQFIIHPNTEVIGMTLEERGYPNAKEAATAIQKGEVYQHDSMSKHTNVVMRSGFIPIKIGQATTPWSTGVSIEVEKMMASSRQLTIKLLIVLAIVLLGVALALYMITRKLVTKPIKKTASFAKAIASGNLDEPITIKSMDEIGQLTSTLDNEVRKAFKDIDQARSVSEKQSEYQAEQVDKLVVNLERLSKGELYCDMDVSSADEDTQEIYNLFSNISNNLHDSINTIRKYINEISAVLSDMSSGNMDVEITSEYRGDFVELKQSINSIAYSLNDVLMDISVSADQVASGTRQVSDGSQEISQGATEQASAIEELTATVTQIAAQTKQNAVNANEANELSMKAKDDAVQGNEKMGEMLNSMEDINTSSENISKIIKVIDDIAFQTNILALNAAVEAARAGVHGKGFAVVAEEVRNLAARSADAAKETTTLIEDSMKKVDEGTKIAQETAEALENIVTGVEKAVQLVGNITAASNEQATGVSQVNNGIEQLSSVVQTNSATAEESAAASEELSSQAEMLKDMVGQFNLKTEGQKIAAPKVNKTAEDDTQPQSTGKPVINLSDDDFGKY